MPSNKSAYIRYKIIDQILGQAYQWDRGVSKTDIILKIKQATGKDISGPQIDKDIRFLREVENAPIKNKNKAYLYSKPFKLGMDLNDKEISFLEFISRNALTFLKDTELNTVNNALIKKFLLFSQAKQHPKVIFEIPESIAGIKNFDPLFKAIEDKQVIELFYSTYNNDSYKKHILSPYFIKEHWNRFYLIAYNHKHADIGIYAFDRIVKIQSKENVKYVDLSLDPVDYFKDAIGITRPNEEQKPLDIKIRVSEECLPYLLSKPMHTSQRRDLADQNIFYLKVYPSPELDMTLLSYGKGVKVLEPVDYQCKIIDTISEMHSIYQKEEPVLDWSLQGRQK